MGWGGLWRLSFLTQLKIQTRIVLLVALPLVVVFTLFGLVALRALSQSTRQSLQERLLITQVVASNTDQELRQVLGSLEGIAGLLASGQDPTLAQNALRYLVLFSGTLDGAFILDLGGQVVWGDPASQV